MATNDVFYFRDLLDKETQKLLVLCKKWENFVDSTGTITEENFGHIRAATGQAHLLINQRFKQFSGLIDDCEFHTSIKETTCNDLHGFWDMIQVQVKDIEEKFNNLEILQSSNWKTVEDIKSKKLTKKSVCKIERKALHSLALRNHIQEARQKMKSHVDTPYSNTGIKLEDKENVNIFEVLSNVTT